MIYLATNNISGIYYVFQNVLLIFISAKQMKSHLFTVEGTIILVAMTIVIFTVKLFIRSVLTSEIIKWKTKKPPSAKVYKKIQTSLYKAIYYISAVILGISVLYNEEWALKLDLLAPHAESMPMKFKIYYIYEICFYINELLTMVYEPKKKDFFQMICHHTVSLILMYLSYSPQYLHFGVVILLLHDISDPILEIAKLAHYLGEEIGGSVTIFVFVIVFVVSRLLIYPRHIVLQAWNYIKNEGFTRGGIVIITGLLLLQLMHIIWSFYIFALLMKVMRGEALEDPRDVVKKKE